MSQRAGAAKVTARERERQAIALRKGGATYEEIGRALGVARTTAYQAVRRALVRLAQESREDAIQLRQLELVRLDGIQVQMTRILDGQDSTPRQRCDAADRLIKVSERRARLLNLDAWPPPPPPPSPPPARDEFDALLDACQTPEEVDQLWELRRRAHAADPGPALTPPPALPPG
jgi:DNA-binding CsgD family transcriptional regulator